MDTATAAQTAGVTVPTVRTWCRRNAVAAVKVAGRWVIDAASLAYRVTIGRQHMTQPRYTVEPYETQQIGTTRTYWRVARTDGTPATYSGDLRIAAHHGYAQRERAELVAEFLNRTPDCYRIERRQTGRSFGSAGGWEWKVTGGRQDDPRDINVRMSEDWTAKPGSPAEGKTLVDMLVGHTLTHDKGAGQRIADHAEKRAVAEAERAVREARETQLAELRAKKGQLATARQVEYILDLLERRRITGEGGGFYLGPTDRAGIEEMSKVEASVYITSLRGEY